MARKMTEWPSKRGPITKIMPSDGCIGDTVPLAVGKWYDFHEFGWYMGNVGLALIVAGFPSSDQLYELEENNHLGSVKRNVIALPDGQPADKSLMGARFVESLEFEPDGLKWKPGLCDSI